MSKTMIMGISLFEKDINRFWSKVNIAEEDKCWNWTGSKHKLGYGNFKIGGKYGKVAASHRVAMAISCENFEDSKHCLHTCDNRSCCNPKHLWFGSHNDNMHDAAIKLRTRSPRIGNGKEKISAQLHGEIVNLFVSGMNKSAIARKFGVTPTNIRFILRKFGHG